MVYVFVVIFFCEQGEKGDRGPVIRPKVRRFVVMKGDIGPPGIKGNEWIIFIKWISFEIIGLIKAIVVILFLDRKVIVVLQGYQEGRVFR